jgi:hypothetical protein
VDEIQATHPMLKMQTKRQVSMQSVQASSEASATQALDNLKSIRSEMELGLCLMQDIHSRLEQAYLQLSPSK